MNKLLLSVLGIVLAGEAVSGQQYLITTVAGSHLPATPAPAVTLSVARPGSIAVDSLGNAYFSSGWYSGPAFIFKMDRAGVLTRVAGTGADGYSGDGGPAINAQLSAPYGVALDAAGSLYIADSGNCVIRKVAPDGTITTVAGNGTRGYSGDGGPATDAQFNTPYFVALDAAGSLYIGDTENYVVRKVAPNGIIATVAGNGAQGHSGDGGPATNARLYTPYGLAVDPAGNLFIADSPSLIRKVAAATGIITTVAGSIRGYSGDGGPATNAQLNVPVALVLDGAGNLYIADNHNHAVRKIAPNGTITTVAGNGTQGDSGDGGPATSAQLNWPIGVALDAMGGLYVTDTYNNRIRRVAPNGIISAVAGNGTEGYSGDGGPATEAELLVPLSPVADAAGNLYLADSYNNRVRRVTPDGNITTVAGNGSSGYSGDGGPATTASIGPPQGLALDAAGNLYLSAGRVRKVSANGTVTTIAGTGTSGYSGDGAPATNAQLNNPQGLVLDGAGNLYIADCYNHAIRKVASNGIITTVAGNGHGGYSGDGGPATSAQLNQPNSVAVDAAGNLYIADTSNDVIRKVSTGGTITTVAGSGPGGGQMNDGIPATSYFLNCPNGVAVDAAGNLYIATFAANRIHKVTPDGMITTIAGGWEQGYSGDGGLATNAELSHPSSVAVGTSGSIYIADTGNRVIRLLAPQGTRALLSIIQTHSADFEPGQMGAAYSILLSNASLAGPTSGTVTATEIVPTGLTLVSMSGLGWSCSNNVCSRSDALDGGASYPPIAVTVNVAADAPAEVVDQVTVSGGGSPAASARALTRIAAAALAGPVLTSPANGATGISIQPTLIWNSSSGAASYDVYFGTLPSPPFLASTTTTSYAPGVLISGMTYYWQIVARNGPGSGHSEIWSFTTVPTPPKTGLRFVPVTPCRIADTRNAEGTFGGPSIAGGTARSFAVPQSACGIPASAQAYSLNVTAVPQGALYYLTLWPTGQTQPLVSTLNSWSGDVVANAAIVPAGSGGAVSVFVSNTADVILDINGYFDTSTGATSFAFYPATPCRVADTRDAVGQFGGPSIGSGLSRDFPITSSACAIPATARGYSLNFTVVPPGYLGYLSTWPTGQAQPLVSTLNSWKGKIVANAAIVPGGSNESISVFASETTDVVLDINGYFAQPGSAGALAFYPATPCRIGDTRDADGPFGGPIMTGGSARAFAVPASACGIPTTAAAYSVNVTVVPSGMLSYLTVWPTGLPKPWVSTLNSLDGSVLANAAIVPAGANGAITVFVTNDTHVILDINGYFAP